MSISPFSIQNPSSFGFDTPGLASAHSKRAVESPPLGIDAELAVETETQAPAPASARSIDPMLLVYQERVETFRQVAHFLRRGFNALTGRRPASRRTARRMTNTLAAN